MLSVVGARAQQPSFIEFFGNYAVREGFTSVELGRRMMQMMTRQAGRMLRWRNCCKASARFGSSWRIPWTGIS